MWRAIVVAVGLVILAVPSSARAQTGIWLQRGVSGLEVSSGVSYSSAVTSLLVGAGYSYEGVFDVDLQFGWGSVKSDLPDLNVYSVGPSIWYHVLKQTKDVPVSVSVGANYSRSFYSSDVLSAADESISEWNAGAHVAAYRFFPLGERVGVTPAVTAGWVHGSITDSTPDDEQTLSDDALAMGFGANLAYLDHGGHIWGVSPQLLFGTSSMPTVLLVSLVFVATMQP
jgi:hypothetical protein